MNSGHLLASVALTIGYAVAAAQTLPATLKVGDPAPEIALERLLQAPTGAVAGLKNLKGNVVVIEFWATWCAPCVPGIAHLNELSEQFKGQPVQFIAITDEDEAIVRRFVDQKPIAGWIGLDPSTAVFQAYVVDSRPHTVIIDPVGRIAAITEPKNVSAAAISDLLAGKKIALPIKARSDQEDLNWDTNWYADQIDPAFQVIIKPINPLRAVAMRPLPDHFVADGIYLEPLIGWAYEFPPARVEIRLPKSQQQYRVSVIVPPGREDLLHPMAQQAMEATFGFKTRREKREMDTLVLSLPAGKPPKLHASSATEPSTAGERGWIKAQKQPLKTLVDQLQLFALIPNCQVLDETGLKESYDWELPYDRASDQVVLNAIREQLGLEVIKTKRALDVLIVEKAESR